jgi:membrane protease YdiL (CAAX protease family)
LLTIIYMAIVGAVWAVNDVNYNTVGDNTRNIMAGIIVPIGLGAIFLAIAASVLGWWRPALREIPRVGPRWLLLIPAIYVVAALGGLLSVDFANVEGKYVLYLAIATLLVGFSEEMLCRGLGLVGLRGSLPEVWVWFSSCLIFGAIHTLNIAFGAEVGITVAQIGLAFLAGTVFYVLRRNTGALIWAMLLHAFWDFNTLIASTYGASDSPARLLSSLQYVAVLLAVVGLVIILRKGVRPEVRMHRPV